MKINVNYDLMEKIQTSNNGVSLKKHVKKYGIMYGVWFGLLTALDLVSLHESRLVNNAAICCFGASVWITLDGLKSKLYEERDKAKAYEDLEKLSRNLAKLDVNTNADLLKEAEVVKTNYRLKINDNYLPVLKQDKYILVSTHNGIGGKCEETLLQERIVGSRGYDLSVHEPDKQLQYSKKLVLQN